MSIRRKEEIQSDAIRNLLNEGHSTQRGKKKGASALISGTGEEGDVQVNVGLASVINSEFNPESMRSERAARVAEIQRQVKSGTYKLPPGKDLAMKLVEELTFEIAEGKNLKERDE